MPYARELVIAGLLVAATCGGPSASRLEDDFGGGTSVLEYTDSLGATHADTVFLKGSFEYTASVGPGPA